MKPFWSSQKLARHIFHLALRFVLPFLVVTACSASGESARYKEQARQFSADARLAEAVLTYRQALKLHPDDPDLLHGLGTALASQGRGRSAATVLTRAASLRPDDATIRAEMATLTTRPQDGLSLSLAWIANGPDAEPVGAAVAAGRIFVSYAGGRLLAFDESSGNVLWDVQSPNPLLSPPAADADQVWAGADDGSIFVYAAATGQSMGAFRTGSAVYAAPALTATVAFCPSNDGTLYALDRESLGPLWKAALGDALHVSPLVTDTNVYVGSIDGRVYALDAATGRRTWTYGILTQGAVESVPTLAEARIFVGSGDGRLYALDAAAGGEYWRFSTPDAIYARPFVLNDQLIVASTGQLLASLRLQNGVAAWTQYLDHPIVQAPAVFKDKLYVVTRSDPRLFAVDSTTGARVGDLNTGDWIAYGPLAAGTDLILVGQDGAVFLYR